MNTADSSSAPGLAARLGAALDSSLPEARLLRRRLHAAPRLGGVEEPTAALMAEALDESDAPAVAGSGRLLRIGPDTGPAVAVRAELDALPIVEITGVPWAAVNGAMHACGHDVHLAALWALATAVREVGSPVALLVILQPREEVYPCGAVDVLAAPELVSHQVAAFLGVHVQPRLPRGEVSAPAGPVNASADEFSVRVRGRGGHAAYPHLTRDPVVAICAVVTALQHLVSRRVDPMHPAVLSVGNLHAGEAANVVPDHAVLQGTIRLFGEQDRRELLVAVAETARLVAEGHGCSADTEVRDGEPVLRNDADLARLAAPHLRRSGFRAAAPLRSCGADDFAYYSTAGPSLMAFVGTSDSDGAASSLHASDFLPPEESVGDVARVMLAGYLAGMDLVGEQVDTVTTGSGLRAR